MKRIWYPDRSVWRELCKRPVMDGGSVSGIVTAIIGDVRSRGESALREYAERFDVKAPQRLLSAAGERAEAASRTPETLRRAIDQAYANISSFHRSQVHVESLVETMPGITCFRRAVPIERVGLYIPGGTAPLFSTLLMLGIPARLAGCGEIVLATPPSLDGSLYPAIAYCAEKLRIDEVYLMGGAQAIAALAFGTENICPVAKICGPGNRFVNEAKIQVASAGIAIDLPAGPSEVLVVGDRTAAPSFIAADLLAQAEHGADSHVVFVTTDEGLFEKIDEEIELQLGSLPRAAVAREALESSLIVLVRSIDEAIEFSNLYAPEHLILNVEGADRYVGAIRNAGSVFLGRFSPESLGDYASGTNHVLPTNGAARAFGGVSVDTFVKKITFQSINSEGLAALAPAVVEMARAEGLEAHARAVLVRRGGDI